MHSYTRKKPRKCGCKKKVPAPASETRCSSLFNFILSRTRLVHRLRHILLRAPARRRRLA